NEHDSMFLRLPGELRNKVYRYVLGGRTLRLREEIMAKAQIEDPVVAASIGDTSDMPQNLAFLAVCRKIYHETRLLPFTLNTFHFRHVYHLPTTLQQFAPSQTQAITRIRF
ncbi:hypothetical protein EK21DRAFT_49110, partial [Setomelanomma holmii]